MGASFARSRSLACAASCRSLLRLFEGDAGEARAASQRRELRADLHGAARRADAREELREERETRGLSARIARFTGPRERVETLKERVVRLTCGREREREGERGLALHRGRLRRREHSALLQRADRLFD